MAAVSTNYFSFNPQQTCFVVNIAAADKTFEYANANYILLGEIIRYVTGKPFEEFVEEVIIDELNLKDTCIIYHNKKCHSTKGYLNLKKLGLSTSDKYVTIDDFTAFNGVAGCAGNMVSNLHDLDVFLKSLVSSTFFPFGKMISIQNEENYYKNGIMDFGNGMWGHSGMTLDSPSLMIVDAKTSNTFILLTADSSIDVESFMQYYLDL